MPQTRLRLTDMTSEQHELVAVAELALRYLEHPDITEIPFAVPSQSVADRLEAAIAAVRRKDCLTNRLVKQPEGER